MANNPNDKTGGTLEFSDMINPANPRAAEPSSPASPSLNQLPTIDNTQSDFSVFPSSPPVAESNDQDHAATQISASQLVAGQTSTTTASIQPHETPTPVSPSSGTANSSPVFHNPLAASSQGHLAEFGAPLPEVPTLTKSPAASFVPVRLNLSPLYDAFVQNGLNVSEPSQATTLLGKIALLLKLDKLKSQHAFRYAAVGLISFAVFLLIFNFQTIGVQVSYWLNPPKPTAPVASPQVSNPPNQLTGAAQADPAPPGNVIIIPKLNVNVPMILEPSINEAAIQKALEKGVVHYAGTALPGERSNIVVVGHSSNDWWEPGNYKFVFALLDKLAVGDQIQVNYEQKKYVFQVSGSKVVEPSEISVLQPTAEPQLTLITCTPPGTSWKRLVITAKQIAPLENAVPDKGQVADAGSANKAALPGNAPSLLDQIKGWFGLGPKDPTPTPVPATPSATPKRNYLPEAV